MKLTKKLQKQINKIVIAAKTHMTKKEAIALCRATLPRTIPTAIIAVGIDTARDIAGEKRAHAKKIKRARQGRANLKTTPATRAFARDEFSFVQFVSTIARANAAIAGNCDRRTLSTQTIIKAVSAVALTGIKTVITGGNVTYPRAYKYDWSTSVAVIRATDGIISVEIERYSERKGALRKSKKIEIPVVLVPTDLEFDGLELKIETRDCPGLGMLKTIINLDDGEIAGVECQPSDLSDRPLRSENLRQLKLEWIKRSHVTYMRLRNNMCTQQGVEWADLYFPL